MSVIEPIRRLPMLPQDARPTERNWGALALGVFILVTLAGNILVVLSVRRFPRLRSQVCFHILSSLAIADVCVSLTVMPFSIVEMVLNRWPFGSAACRAWIFCDVMCCTASILHLCLVALDRYLAIGWPLKYTEMVTKRRIHAGIALVWVIGAAVSAVLVWLSVKDKDECDLNPRALQAAISSTTSFFVPGLVMSCLYARIFCIAINQAAHLKRAMPPRRSTPVSNGTRLGLRRRSCCLGGSGGSQSSLVEATSEEHRRQNAWRSEAKAVRTVGLLLGCFISCWLPFFVFYVVRANCASCINEQLFKAVTWVGYVNSSLNPVLYVFMQREFRTAFRKLTVDLVPCWRADAAKRNSMFEGASSVAATRLFLNTRAPSATAAAAEARSLASQPKVTN